MQIQDLFLSLGEGGCLAIDYAIASLNGETSEREVFNRLMDARDSGAFDDECYVTNPTFFENIKNVVKRDRLDDCNGEYVAARYDFGKKSHFVLYKKYGDGAYEPYYNSLDKSNCVKYGRITTVRDIYLNEIW
jgi:hypothetical protein